MYTLHHACNAFVIVISAMLLTCTTKSAKRIELLTKESGKENYTKTIKSIRKNPELYGNLNQVLYWYDLGVLFHYTGQYDTSLYHFEQAEKVIDELFTRSVTNEIASIMTNDNVRPYRAKRYEQILMHQLMALDYCEKDLPDEALVEARKVQLVFDRFLSQDKGTDKYNDDGMAHYLASILYDMQGEDDEAAISLYKSVKAYNNGPVPLPDDVRDLAYYRFIRQGREDDIGELGLQTAREQNRVPGLYDDPRQSEIILVGYVGKGPLLQESIFWGTYVVDGLLVVYYRNPYGDTVALTMPAPSIPEEERKKDKEGKTKSGSTFHIKFAVPSFVPRESSADYFTVVVKDSSAETSTPMRSTILTNTEYLLQRDMDDNQLKTVARTALRVVLRTVAQQKAKKELATGQPLLNLLVNVGTDILADQLEKADTRLCFFLPRTVQIVRIPVTPGIHSVESSVVDKKGYVVDQKIWNTVIVKEGEKKFLIYPALL